MTVTQDNLAQDPVCGMTVSKATAIKLERGGKTYYFCSSQCQRTFESEATLSNHQDGTATDGHQEYGAAIHDRPAHGGRTTVARAPGKMAKDPTNAWWESPSKITLYVFLGIIAFFLITEHRAHVIPLLPWAFLLLCPFMHLFMHGGHGGGEDQSGSGSNNNSLQNKEIS